MRSDTDFVLATVQRLVSEELHLTGQQVGDSLQPGQARRLADVRAILDQLRLLVGSRRPVRPTRPPDRSSR